MLPAGSTLKMTLNLGNQCFWGFCVLFSFFSRESSQQLAGTMFAFLFTIMPVFVFMFRCVCILLNAFLEFGSKVVSFLQRQLIYILLKVFLLLHVLVIKNKREALNFKQRVLDIVAVK